LVSTNISPLRGFHNFYVPCFFLPIEVFGRGIEHFNISPDRGEILVEKILSTMRAWGGKIVTKSPPVFLRKRPKKNINRKETYISSEKSGYKKLLYGKRFT